MSKKLATAALLIFCFVALCAFVFGGRSEYYEKYEKYKYAFFPNYSTIDGKTSEKDRAKSEEILKQVEAVLEYTDELTEGKFGELTCFAEKNAELGAVRAEADIRLINAKFSFMSAYVWGEYDLKIYGKDDEILSSETDNLFYLKIKTSDGVHTVTKVKTIS